mgnify:CR=1 FL=1
MQISFEHPEYLWLLFFALAAAVIIVFKSAKMKKLAVSFVNKNTDKLGFLSAQTIYIRMIVKGILRILAWCSLVLALAGISWGSISTPVQKNGKSCAFVFDISYSMMATDAPNSLTRLEASADYASMLMNYMNGISISCILAKGDGVIAIPQTEDFSIIHSLLEILSPEMMSSKGSSLGKGIETALKSFPSSSSKAPVIFLFTDGDETDPGLQSAVNKAVRSGVQVCIIGFGSVQESEITAGDGVTVVRTALRDEKLRRICDEINKKNQAGSDFSFIQTANAKFVDASELGSAVKVMSTLRNAGPDKKLSVDEILTTKAEEEDLVTVSYEMQTVNRHHTFLVIAIILFILSFIVSEISVNRFRFLNNISMMTVILSLSAFSFNSCSAGFKDSKRILESTWNWYQKDYNKAISGFTEVIENAERNNDELTKQYALYGLSVTYLMQNEKNASFEKLEQISPDAPVQIRFASYYNAGIIAQREGDYDKAVNYFKMALLVSPDDVNAKINLELSQAQESQKAKEGQQELTPTADNNDTESDVENTIFKRIRENDQNQWKNYENQDQNDSVIDY